MTTCVESLMRGWRVCGRCVAMSAELGELCRALGSPMSRDQLITAARYLGKALDGLGAGLVRKTVTA